MYKSTYLPTHTALHSPLCSTQLGLHTPTVPQPGHPAATLLFCHFLGSILINEED